jgi:sec-independent protein translocase protein TatC
MPDDNKELPAPGGEPQQTEFDEPAAVYSSASDPYGQTLAVESEVASEAHPALVAPLETSISAPLEPSSTARPPAEPPPPPPPPPPAEEDEEDEEERGMLRMSFMDHLGELRSRLLRAIGGVLLAFIGCVLFCGPLWRIVSGPAVGALKHLGVNPPRLVAITPMEQFNVIYLKLPLLVSVFVGAPWIFYQVWGFISPGLYKREKKWAVPFILCTAGLFIAGGCFAYFVAFRYGLEFLLGIGLDLNVQPMVSINEYFDLFVNVTLGVGLVFEMPVIIFFLTLLRLASPRFLLRHSRYAILAITIIAAIVTPTPDVFNMMIFAVPMVMLFFIGVFVSYLLVLKREEKKFPWGKIMLVILGIVLLLAGILALFVYRYHYHFIRTWPFFVK